MSGYVEKIKNLYLCDEDCANCTSERKGTEMIFYHIIRTSIDAVYERDEELKKGHEKAMECLEKRLANSKETV